MSVTVSIAQINIIVGIFKQNLQMISDAINRSALAIRVTKRAVNKYRRYPISSHYRWNLT